jgi:hypothetical protein
MPWVRLDDEFAQHPKVVSLPYRGRWLHIAALCYSNRMLTDGFVPLAMLASLCPHEQDDPIGEDAYHLAEQLVSVGLWEDGEGGYVIHDYHHYQPSKREVMEARKRLRAARSVTGKKGADRRWRGDSKADSKPYRKADGKAGS